MWSTKANLPSDWKRLGPRPGSPDNVFATDFLADYSPQDQVAGCQLLRAKGYTHAVVGPLVDSDGYRGMWSPNDWRGRWEEFLDLLQFLWNEGLAPVVFVHPDDWTFTQCMRDFSALLSQPRAQRLIRIVVPTGWEPTRYGWSSWTWQTFFLWAATVLPDALMCLHTVPDTDAPGGTDALGNDDGKGNGSVWRRVAPLVHCWLMQTEPFDPANATALRNFCDTFRGDVFRSTRNHFLTGYDGWPQGSKWGPTIPLTLIAAEYQSARIVNQNGPEADAIAIGDAVMAAGADGYLDGGSVDVPRRG